MCVIIFLLGVAHTVCREYSILHSSHALSVAATAPICGSTAVQVGVRVYHMYIRLSGAGELELTISYRESGGLIPR